MRASFICEIVDGVSHVILVEEDGVEKKPTLASVGLEAKRQYASVYNRSLELRNKANDIFKYLDGYGERYFLEDITSENSKFVEKFFEVVALLTDIQKAITQLRGEI